MNGPRVSRCRWADSPATPTPTPTPTSPNQSVEGQRPSRITIAVGGAGVAAAILLAGCSSGTAHRTSGASPSATTVSVAPGSSSSSASTSTSRAPSRSSKPSAADSPGTKAAAASGSLVQRGDASRAVSAAAEPFSRAVTYTDGASLRILGVKQTTTTANGPGVIVGPATVFAVEFTNRSSRSVDLSSVVTKVTYGVGATVAAPVYTVDGAQDFSGTVKPGQSVQTTYAYAIPVAQLSHVVMVIDFDGLHTAATFTGAVSTK